MSMFTNFLNLFKWDIKTDSEEEFNIEKALNENWDKIDNKMEQHIGRLNSEKVDKIEGKQLSTNDYTNVEKNKLLNIEESAQVNKIEKIKQNGIEIDIDNKEVDIIIPDVYNKIEVDDALATKANKDDVYDKTKVDTFLNDERQKSDVKYSNALKGTFEQQKNTQIKSDASYLQNVILGGESVQNDEPSIEKLVDITNMQGKVNINMDNKNLIRTNLKSGSLNGISYTVNADNSITLSGTATADTYVNLDFDSLNPLQIAQTYYTLSAGVTLPNGVILVTRKQDDATPLLKLENMRSITVNLQYSGNVYSFFKVNNGITVNNLTIYPQLERGNTASDYVKNSNNTASFTLKRAYAECDYIDVDNMQDVQNRARLVLNGSEAWVLGAHPTQNNTKAFATTLITSVDSDNVNCMCNKLKAYTANQLWRTDTAGIAQSRSQIIIRIPAELGITTAEQLKTWLASNNLEVEYTLDSPIIKNLSEVFTEQEITALQNLKTYNSVTNISSTAMIDALYNRDINYVVNNPFENIYPVGSVVLNTSGADPFSYLNIGIWEQIAKGKTIFGVDENNVDFNTVKKIGGEHTHRHNFKIGLKEYFGNMGDTSFVQSGAYKDSEQRFSEKTGEAGTHNVTINQSCSNGGKTESAVTAVSEGDTALASSLPPYITCYIWERIA